MIFVFNITNSFFVENFVENVENKVSQSLQLRKMTKLSTFCDKKRMWKTPVKM